MSKERQVKRLDYLQTLFIVLFGVSAVLNLTTEWRGMGFGMFIFSICALVVQCKKIHLLRKES